jgi:creatinine amidohydrolase
LRGAGGKPYNDEMFLENLKWPGVKRIDFDKTVVVIPLGSVEQHGPHLPLTTDTEIVTAIAREVEKRLPEQILVTPAMWLGHSPHHMNFPGTLSVEPRVYIDIVKSLVHSMVRHGAKRIFLLNGHGGNEGPAPVALRELKSELSARKEIFVTFASYWWLGAKTLTAVRKSDVGGVGHACEMETSAMLVIAPGKVDMSLARKSGPGAALRYRVIDMQAKNPVAMVSEFDELSDSGVLGEPELASAEKGRLFLDGFAAAVVEFLEDFATWTPEAVKGEG